MRPPRELRNNTRAADLRGATLTSTAARSGLSLPLSRHAEDEDLANIRDVSSSYTRARKRQHNLDEGAVQWWLVLLCDTHGWTGGRSSSPPGPSWPCPLELQAACQLAVVGGSRSRQNERRGVLGAPNTSSARSVAEVWKKAAVGV